MPLPDVSTGAAVTASGLSKRYGDLAAMGPVDLDVSVGEFVAVIGPSGCGKSTLLLAIAGLIGPSEGNVRIEGVEVTGPHPRLGLVFQEPELMAWRNVLANVMLQQEIRHLPVEEYKERALSLLDTVGLSDFLDRYPDQLSGGMAQRVALCRALLHQPEILLMDEPFGALDALTRDRMNTLLNEVWSRSGCTTILVTHSIDEAVFLAERVIVTTARPAKIAGEIRVPFDAKRDSDIRTTPEFQAVAAEVRRLLEQVGAL